MEANQNNKKQSFISKLILILAFIMLIPCAGCSLLTKNESGLANINSISKDQNPITCIFKINGKYGYKDKNGKIIIKSIYDKLQETPEGLIVIIKNDKLGLADNQGKILVEPKYKAKFLSYFEFRFSDGLAAVVKETEQGLNNCIYIDKKGKEILDPSKYGYSTVQDQTYGTCSDFSEGLTQVSYEDQDGVVGYGFMDRNGTLVIKLNDVAGDLGDNFPFREFSEGLAAVPIDNKWGYINKKGEFIIKPQFDEAKSFHNGLAEVYIGDKNSYINKNGRFERLNIDNNE